MIHVWAHMTQHSEVRGQPVHSVLSSGVGGPWGSTSGVPPGLYSKGLYPLSCPADPNECFILFWFLFLFFEIGSHYVDKAGVWLVILLPYPLSPVLTWVSKRKLCLEPDFDFTFSSSLSSQLFVKKKTVVTVCVWFRNSIGYRPAVVRAARQAAKLSNLSPSTWVTVSALGSFSLPSTRVSVSALGA